MLSLSWEHIDRTYEWDNLCGYVATASYPSLLSSTYVTSYISLAEVEK